MRISPHKIYRLSEANHNITTKQIKRFHQTKADIKERTENRIKIAINNLLEKTLTKEKEVQDKKSPFKPAKEKFKNPNLASIAHKIRILVKQSESNPEGRILKMDIFSPEGNRISPFFETGTKNEILEMLKDKALPDKIKKIISETTTDQLKKTME